MAIDFAEVNAFLNIAASNRTVDEEEEEEDEALMPSTLQKSNRFSTLRPAMEKQMKKMTKRMKRK